LSSRAPHVLFLTESFHPVLGGGETHVRRLGAQLAAGGWPVTVVTRRSQPDWARQERLDDLDVVRVEPSGPARRGKYLMVPRAAAELVRPRRRFDLVVVRGTRVLGLPGLLCARWRGVPVVLQPEINGELSGAAYVWGTPLDRAPWRHAVSAAVATRNLLLRDADAFVAMSRPIEAEMLAAGLSREKVAHVPHGVDLQRFRPVSPAEKAETRQRLGLPSDAHVVAWTGRLLKGKGLDTLLEAFAVVAASDPAAVLVLVGSGEGQALSVESVLRERAGQPPLGGRVVFAGAVDDVAPHLAAADVFAFPSEFEALGLSLIEAAACGLACVGARTGGIVDVIEDGTNGLLVAPGDAAGLAVALQRLLGDAALRAALGTRARQDVQARFDEAVSVERYRALFVELVGRGRARGKLIR
jgi:glycosyltransferase involved in cell wall biosynthesis